MPFLEKPTVASDQDAMAEIPSEEVIARFEELSLLESEFEDAELESIRKSNALTAPLYKKRAATISKIPHFWALVLEQSPPELDNYIQPSDSKLFSECLESLTVSRFEIDDPAGSPRSISITFTFKKNKYFTNEVLEKKFWYRKALDGWQGHVSEPVKINWSSEEEDLSDGLTDAAYDLFQAKQKIDTTGLSKGDVASKERGLKEYKALARKIEQSEEASISFFAWFGFVSSWKWVSADESAQAEKKDKEKLEKRRKGEKVEEDEEEDEEDEQQDWQETEVFPSGDEVANLLAEDLWPSAIKYFKMAHEADDDDEELSELEVEDLDDDDSDVEIDIRALVNKGRNSKSSGESPPAKKQRKL